MTRCLVFVSALALLSVTMAAQPGAPANRLTADEQSAGWRLLFDGNTTKGWRGFAKPPGVINGWMVANGRLRHPASSGQDSKGTGDIVTVETFNDFDLRFEWIISSGGNSGVKYLVVENRDGPIAHEYQVIDDAKHPDALIGPHRATGALYDVIAAPASKPLKPAGQINSGRVLVSGNHVEHWLNGVRIVEYELGSALKAAKEKSKFKDVPGWEDKLKGHILLQDHGDDVSFFNIRIRELPATTRQ
jgi:3-keto-disaccharide hydrolase